MHNFIGILFNCELVQYIILIFNYVREKIANACESGFIFWTTNFSLQWIQTDRRRENLLKIMRKDFKIPNEKLFERILKLQTNKIVSSHREETEGISIRHLPSNTSPPLFLYHRTTPPPLPLPLRC